MSETREELREYQCMMDKKHRYITIHAKRVELFEVELEYISENDAIVAVTEMINSNDITPDDSEVTIEDMDIK